MIEGTVEKISLTMFWLRQDEIWSHIVWSPGENIIGIMTPACNLSEPHRKQKEWLLWSWPEYKGFKLETELSLRLIISSLFTYIISYWDSLFILPNHSHFTKTNISTKPKILSYKQVIEIKQQTNK